jgi:guanylate kinase
VADEPLLLIMSSPSGAGKTTLTQDVLAHFPDLMFSVSHTTRRPRGNEVDGRDYHFIDPAGFRRQVAEDAFAEWAEVHGNLYGTSFREIERCQDLQKRGIVFDIDYQGARQIKARCPSAVGIFVLPPSMEELKRRLRTRASDDESAIERRFANAKREIEHYGLFDYLLVNDDLEHAKHRLRSIIVAERSRRWRMAGAAEQLLHRARGE